MMGNETNDDSVAKTFTGEGIFANRKKVEGVKSAIRSGGSLDPHELDTFTKNFRGILKRLKRTPIAYNQIIKEVFNGNQSMIRKFTNREAKERRKKPASFLKKIEEISESIERMVPSDADKSMLEYQAERMVLELVRGTHFANDADYSTISSVSGALDDLWGYFNQLPAVIDRKTDLCEKFLQLDNYENWDIYDWGSNINIVEAGKGNTDNITPLWALMNRVNLCTISSDVSASGTIHILEPDCVISEKLYGIEKEKELVDITSQPGRFEGAAEEAIAYECSVYIYQKIYLVIRPDLSKRRLKFSLMLDAVTSSTKGIWPDSEPNYHVYWREIPHWNNKQGAYKIEPSVATSENPTSWEYRPNMGDPDKLLIAWLEVPDFKKIINSKKFLGGPNWGTSYPGLEKPKYSVLHEDYDITREDIDLFNDIEIDYVGSFFDNSQTDWHRNLPTDLNVLSIAHAFEYFLIDTASSTGTTPSWAAGTNSESFVPPKLVSLAQEKADQLDRFLKDLRQEKVRSRQRLERIIDGQETLD